MDKKIKRTMGSAALAALAILLISTAVYASNYVQVRVSLTIPARAELSQQKEHTPSLGPSSHIKTIETVYRGTFQYILHTVVAK